MSKHPETDAARDIKNKRPLPHQKRRHRLTKSYRPNVQATEGIILLELEADFRAELSSMQSARTRHVIIGTLESVLLTSLKQDAFFGIKCRFRHVEADGQPDRKSKKSGDKGSVA